MQPLSTTWSAITDQASLCSSGISYGALGLALAVTEPSALHLHPRQRCNLDQMLRCVYVGPIIATARGQQPLDPINAACALWSATEGRCAAFVALNLARLIYKLRAYTANPKAHEAIAAFGGGPDFPGRVRRREGVQGHPGD